MTTQLESLSIFFPAYNDAGTIASMVAAARLAARQVAQTYEIIVINDGSHDHTAQILNALTEVYPELRVIQHPENRGYGGALRSGFAAARNQWIFYTDGDAQYNPLELPRLVAALQPQTDMVNGYKVRRSDAWVRIFAGALYNAFVRFAFGIRLRDVDCDFRLMRRAIFDSVQLHSESGIICVEMVKKIEQAGFKIAEIPVQHYPRAYGSSQFFRIRRLLPLIYQLAALWWNLRDLPQKTV